MKTLKELKSKGTLKVKRIFINHDGTEQTPLFGEIVFRSKDYIFKCEGTESYGYVLKQHLRDYGFEIEAVKGTIQYHVLT